MASSLQQVVEDIQLNNYMSLVVLTGVGYDYILTFADEIEYVWNKRWTWVSTLFIFARYFGLCSVIINALWGSRFFPGPAKQFVWLLNSCATTFLVEFWAQMIFLGAAELAMILRVWALYNRSMIVLGTLLTFYAIELASLLVACIMLSMRKDDVATTVQILDFSLCVQQFSPIIPNLLINGAQIALGALMCLLYVSRFIREAFQWYEATHRIHLNQYMGFFVREGMIYFLAILAYAFIGVLANAGSISVYGWRVIIIATMDGIPPYTLVPRFILNLRKLYACGQRGILGGEIDTAFGLAPRSDHDTVRSAIMFADARPTEEGEEMQMEERKCHDNSNV